MHVQRNLVHEGFDADGTAVRSLFGVSPDVGLQMNLLREALTTEGTAVRLLPRVDPRVQLETLVRGEILFTDGALVVFSHPYVIRSHKFIVCGSRAFKCEQYVSVVCGWARVFPLDWVVSVSVGLCRHRRC